MFAYFDFLPRQGVILVNLCLVSPCHWWPGSSPPSSSPWPLFQEWLGTGVVGGSWFCLISAWAGFCRGEHGPFGFWVIGPTGFRVVLSAGLLEVWFISPEASLQSCRRTIQGKVPSSASCGASPDPRAAMKPAPEVNKAGSFCAIA